MTRTFVSAALAAAALLTAAPAAAATADTSAYLMFVPVGDLDLAARADERRLERRLRLAARQLCGAPTAPGLHEWRLIRACRMSFMEAGRLKVEQVWAERRTGGVAIAASR